MYKTNKEDHEELEEKERPYRMYEQKMHSRAFHFYISGPVVEPAQYTDMIHQIRVSQPSDVIHIHLNTPGGHLTTGVQIINSIKASQAHIVTHLESEVCSLGSILFLTGDEMVVYDNCVMMFHNYSSGYVGKGHELTSYVEATSKWYHKLMKDVCSPFLSDEELDRIARGEDLWMQSEEIADRLQRMVNIMADDAKKDNSKPRSKKKVASSKNS